MKPSDPSIPVSAPRDRTAEKRIRLYISERLTDPAILHTQSIDTLPQAVARLCLDVAVHWYVRGYEEALKNNPIDF